MSSDDYDGQFDDEAVKKQGGRELSFDEYISDSNRSKGGASSFKWRDKGSATVYLHPKAPWLKIWGHQWPRLVEFEDKDGDKQKAFWSRRYTCVEDEKTSILKRFFRDKTTKRREHPAESCPMCRFDDWLYASIHVGELYEHCLKKVKPERYKLPGLDEKQQREKHQALAVADALVTKAFSWHHDDVPKDLVITAGGMLGLFKDKMTGETKIAFKKAGLSLAGDDGVFKEKTSLKVQYVWGVVNANAPEDGSFIAVETEALGKHMQEELAKQKKRVAKSLRKSETDPAVRKQADPRENPYPFEWSYDKDQEFSKKYGATALTDEKPSEAVLAAFEQEAPDMSKLRELGDPEALRTEMETYCVLPVTPPWDDIFGPSTKGSSSKSHAKKPSDDEIDQPYAEESSKKVEKATPKKAEPTVTVTKRYDCDVCGTNQPLNDECVNCGAKFGEDGLVVGGHYELDEKEEPVKLIARDCTKCGTPIDLPFGDADFEKYKVVVCGKCGTMHEHPKWTVKALQSKELKTEPAKKRDRRTVAT
jgi:hypothetical protein